MHYITKGIKITQMSSAHTQYETFYNKYPHLKSKIQFTWGTAECRKILSESMMSDREGRAGFPPEDAKMLFNILRKHDQLFPQHNPDKPGDPPFKIFQTAKHPVYRPENKGFDLTSIAKVLAAVGLLIIVVKEAIRFLK